MKTQEEAIAAAREAADRTGRTMFAYTYPDWTHWGNGSESWVSGMVEEGRISIRVDPEK